MGLKKGTPEQKAAEAARRRQFFDTWLTNGRRGKEAALSIGVSEKSAAVMASKWLKAPEFVEELERIDKLAREKSEITVERIVLELARLALVDISQAYATDGSLKPMHEWPEDVRRACLGFETTETLLDDEEGTSIGKAVLKKVKFHDKTAALDKLMRHFPAGYAAAKLEVKDVTNHGDQMQAIIERRAKALAEATPIEAKPATDE